MFCGRCGVQLPEGARFCSACGAPASGGMPTPGAMPPQPDWAAPEFITRLYRPRANRMIAGVCAGLAQHYRWDLTWVRVLTVLIAIFSSGAGLVAYIVFWIVMPEEPWMLSSGPAGPPPPPAPGA